MSDPKENGYPGLGLNVRHDWEHNSTYCPIGAHDCCRQSRTKMLPVRELAMMDIMDRLTDKEDWHKKVFDGEIVEKWKKEALAIKNEKFWRLATNAKAQNFGRGGEDTYDSDRDGPDSFEFRSSRPPVVLEIMSEQTFNCCIEELRSKARYFEETGIIPTFDAYSSVVKSDHLVDEGLREELVQAFTKLKADHAVSPDWHPRSNEMVQDLVHPSLYPLVYGRSLVFKEECVGVKDAVGHWAGKGVVILEPWRDTTAPLNIRSYIPPKLWSDEFQWLPSNVAFQDDGSVKFTSYVNNLHPERYPDIYRTIEKLIQTSLPMWDQCLRFSKGYKSVEAVGRTESRFPKPANPDDDNQENWIPSDPAACADVDVSEDALEDEGWYPDEFEDDPEGLKAHTTEYKWRILRKPGIPEPTFTDIDYAPPPDHRLIHRFRSSGLQIIVKIASIELTPQKPVFPAGGWHIEGQLNERICATALYYLDSHNVTPSSLSFRMSTSPEDAQDEYRVQQDGYHWLESYFGTSLGGSNEPGLQNYGTATTRQGRLLAFPNVFQHRVSSFELEDKTKPGHRRFVALWLVDPNARILSTANVPPQQMSWYVDSLFGSSPAARAKGLAKLPPDLVSLLAEEGLTGEERKEVETTEEGKLPRELMEMVKEHFKQVAKEGMPMSVAEANRYREKLMEERTAFVEETEKGWHYNSYSFCEH